MLTVLLALPARTFKSRQLDHHDCEHTCVLFETKRDGQMAVPFHIPVRRLRACPTVDLAVRRYWGSATRSDAGVTPNMRRYSRLNCVELA